METKHANMDFFVSRWNKVIFYRLDNIWRLR